MTPHLHHYSIPIEGEPHKRRCARGEPQRYQAPTGRREIVASTEGRIAAAPEYGEFAVVILCDEAPRGRKFKAGEIVEVVSTYA